MIIIMKPQATEEQIGSLCHDLSRKGMQVQRNGCPAGFALFGHVHHDGLSICIEVSQLFNHDGIFLSNKTSMMPPQTMPSSSAASAVISTSIS